MAKKVQLILVVQTLSVNALDAAPQSNAGQQARCPRLVRGALVGAGESPTWSYRSVRGTIWAQDTSDKR